MPDKPRQKLSPKQIVFVERYLTHWNAARAAREAGYSEANAKSMGSTLLKDPIIQEARKLRIEELKMTADECLLRIAEIARGEGEAVFNEAGDIDVAALKKQDKAHLIKRFKKKVTHGEFGKNVELEVELHDMLAANVHIGRNLKLWTDKVETPGGSGRTGKPMPNAKSIAEKALARLRRDTPSDE